MTSALINSLHCKSYLSARSKTNISIYYDAVGTVDSLVEAVGYPM
jgi:hypothetical protein